MPRAKLDLVAPLVLNDNERDFMLALSSVTNDGDIPAQENVYAMMHETYEYATLLNGPSNVVERTNTPNTLELFKCINNDKPEFGDLVDPFSVLHGTDTRTTVMFRRVPRRLSQEEFKQSLESAPGMANSVEFVYLPRDNMRRSNRGFAFVNFEAPVYLGILSSIFRSSEGLLPVTIRDCKMYYARIQGKGSELSILIDNKQTRVVATAGCV